MNLADHRAVDETLQVTCAGSGLGRRLMDHCNRWVMTEREKTVGGIPRPVKGNRRYCAVKSVELFDDFVLDSRPLPTFQKGQGCVRLSLLGDIAGG